MSSLLLVPLKNNIAFLMTTIMTTFNNHYSCSCINYYKIKSLRVRTSVIFPRSFSKFLQNCSVRKYCCFFILHDLRLVVDLEEIDNVEVRIFFHQFRPKVWIRGSEPNSGFVRNLFQNICKRNGLSQISGFFLKFYISK